MPRSSRDIPNRAGDRQERGWSGRLQVVSQLSLDRIVLGVFVVVGLLLARGHGFSGFLALLGAGVVLGALMGVVGRRYPMLYRQNRRDRRRDRS